MRKIIFSLVFLLSLIITTASMHCYAAEVNSSDVYTQVLRIEQETLQLQRTLGITDTPEPTKPIKTELLPRHIWAKTYMLLTKIMIFREQKKLPVVRPVAFDPRFEVTPFSNWAQCLRILTEIDIIKQELSIKTESMPISAVTGKRPVDVFNKLNQVSALWSILIGGQITPSYVYAEAMRLNDDVTQLLQAEGVIDNAIPPARIPDSVPGDSLAVAFDVLHELQRLQAQVDIEAFNLDEFYLAKQDTHPQDVFNMIGLLLAELQVLKAKLGMKHSVTPIAQDYENKKNADVGQVLGYIANRLHLLNLHRESL